MSSDLTELQNTRFGRRRMLGMIGVGAVGLASAALIGCGDDDDDDGGTAATATAASGGTAAAGGATAAPTEAAGGVTGAETGIPVVAGDPKPGGTYTIVGNDLRQHDMHTALGNTVWHTLSEKALEIDTMTGEILPMLAEQWEVVDDTGLNLQLKIRPDIFIADVPPWNGRQWTAEDVAWNLERMAGFTADAEGIAVSAFQRSSMVQNITSAEAVDDLTVKITLSEPNSAFFNGLTENRTPMMPREMVDIGFTDPNVMAGPGPFKVESIEEGVRRSYIRNDLYFREGEPYFDRFETLIIPDRAAQLAAFIAGEIQQLSGLQSHELDALRSAAPDANYYTWVGSNWCHFRPNMAFEPFRDFRVRKGMQLATDPAAIGDGFYGEGWGHQAVMHPAYPEGWKADKVQSLPGYNPATTEQDIAEGLKMLAAAGFPEGAGIDFEMLYPKLSGAGSFLEENAIRQQGQWDENFPEMKISLRGISDFASYSEAQSASNFDGVNYVITATPDVVLEAISQFHTTGSRNYGEFSEPELDAILDAAIQELDVPTRTEMMDNFQKRWFEEWQPLQVLYVLPNRTMMQGNIGGFETTAGAWYGYATNTKAGRWYYVD